MDSLRTGSFDGRSVSFLDLCVRLDALVALRLSNHDERLQSDEADHLLVFYRDFYNEPRGDRNRAGSGAQFRVLSRALMRMELANLESDPTDRIHEAIAGVIEANPSAERMEYGYFAEYALAALSVGRLSFPARVAFLRNGLRAAGPKKRQEWASQAQRFRVNAPDSNAFTRVFGG